MTPTEQKDKSASGIWNPLEVPEDGSAHYQIGPLDLWVMRTAHAWQAVVERTQHREERILAEKAGACPCPSRRRRWVVGEELPLVRIRPVMPDRPIVVRPEMPVSILPGQSMSIFIGVPLWIRLFVGEPAKPLAEFPTMIMSNTWFGNVMEGELCYSMRTTAKRNFEQLMPHAHRVACPIQVRNTAKINLSVERVCLRVQYLSIFQGEDRLWANIGRVSFRGPDEASRVIYARGAPDYEKIDHIVSEPRETPRRGFIFRTFEGT